MNANIPRRKGHLRLGPSLRAKHHYTREFLSREFLKVADECEALASLEKTQGRNRMLLLEQAALARKHAQDVRTERVPRVVYVSQEPGGAFVYWRPGQPAECRPLPWGKAQQLAKAFLRVENLDPKSAGLHPRPIRFDPPEAP